MSQFIRDWSNFYEVSKDLEITSKINELNSFDKEEADVTLRT